MLSLPYKNNALATIRNQDRVSRLKYSGNHQGWDPLNSSHNELQITNYDAP